MAKQHTSVTLPGGIAGLVHAAQQPAAAPTVTAAPTADAASTAPKAAPATDAAQPTTVSEAKSQPTVPATAAEYRAALAQGQSRWELFRAMGREYHRTANLGAVYIDRRLKQHLGRLRASSLGLSTSAILSAIVDQFLMEHEDDIEQVLRQ